MLAYHIMHFRMKLQCSAMPPASHSAAQTKRCWHTTLYISSRAGVSPGTLSRQHYFAGAVVEGCHKNCDIMTSVGIRRGLDGPSPALGGSP